MSRHQFSGKWTVRGTVAILVVVAVALLAWVDTLVAQDCPVEDFPFYEPWAGSGHADANSEAFRHWDDDVPPVVSAGCAKCHSTPGHLDFLGADGTAAGTVENEPNVGTTITCTACHNEVSIVMDSVTFPSGIEIADLGNEARCMQCHQGRESTVSVDQRIAGANVPDDDTVSGSLSFRNIHYLPAAVTQLGAETMGGYQYAGKSYDIRFAHVEGLDTCISCHDPHGLEVRVDICTTCHVGVTTEDDLQYIRFKGSASDYDGDGNVAEGIAGEIVGLQVNLYAAIQAYAASMGAPIVYDSHSYPYWFNQGDGSRYDTWTARLVKATFNYQFYMKDPGAYAHNGKYMIQLLYDSIEDLYPGLVAGLHRDDAGHFAGSKEAFRHWDEDGAVPGGCSKCHSAAGLPDMLEEGVTFAQPVANGLHCTTCHELLEPWYTRYEAGAVEFPSGAELDLGDSDNNLCINCHQGRESTVSVDEAVAGLDADTVSGGLRFKNIHYYAAGATLFGANAKGAYEYKGKVYTGLFEHTENRRTCTQCHDSHTLEVDVPACVGCHAVAGLEDIRLVNDTSDYDGDGDTGEGLVGEIETLQDVLYWAIQSYATNVCGVSILYANSYPYFFIDTNGNGQADKGELSSGNRYNAFTPRLIQATYNYQFAKKDPGAFAHNAKYLIQVLSDSVENLATMVTVDMTGMVRPGAENTVDECGDATHPYPKGDLDENCRVNMLDFALFADHWLEDNR